MNTSSKPVGLNNSPSLNDFEIKIGEIPSSKHGMANKLKDLVLFTCLAFEKNPVNDIQTVSFSAYENDIYASHSAMYKPFSLLKIPSGSIIACNFEIYLDNIKELFEVNTDFIIDGVICPEIDKQSVGFLQNHNKNLFVRADKILSRKREKLGNLLKQNKDFIPKLNTAKGETLPDLVFKELQKFI